MSEPLKNFLGLLAIGVVLLCCFSGLCFHPSSILVDPERPSIDHAIRGRPRGVGNDLTSYHLPRLIWVQRSFQQQGRPSYWDPSGFGGRPRIGNPQAGLFYPFAWPAFLLKSASVLGWLTIAHLAFGGFGLFCLAKSSRMSIFAATIAGVCYSSNPYIMAHVFEGHYPHVWSACWYPWAFLCWKKILQGSGFALIMLPIVLAMSLTTGHPQEWYYLAIALGFMAAIDRVAHKPIFRARPLAESSGIYFLSVGLCLGLCAVEIVPNVLSQEWTIKPNNVPQRHDLFYNIQISNLLGWFHPFALGSPDRYVGHGNYWETQLSIGLVPFLLLFVGLLAATKRRDLIRWFVLGFACLIFAAGPKLGLYELCYRILPGMERFRVPSRTLFLANVAWAMLVAAGIDATREGSSSLFQRGVTRTTTLIFILIISLIAALVWLIQQIGHPLSLTSGRRTAIFLVGLSNIVSEPIFWVALFCIGLVVGIPTLRVGWFSRSQTTLDGIDPVGCDSPAHPTNSWQLFDACRNFANTVFQPKNRGLILGFLALLELVVHSQALLKTSRPSRFLDLRWTPNGSVAATPEPADSYRLASLDSVFSDLNAAHLGLEKTNVNDIYQNKNAYLLYEKLYDFLDPRHPPGWGTHSMDQATIRYKAEMAQAVLDRMSVKWVVTTERPDLPGLEPVHTSREASEGFSVARNRDPLPRAYVVPRALSADGRLDPSINWLRDTSAREFVLLEVADPLPAGARESFRAAGYRSVDPDHVVVEVKTYAPGFLVVTNTWDPGWTATIDGKPSPVLRGNLAQQVVALPTVGSHCVELRFRPRGLSAGLWISFLSFVVWCGLLTRWASRRERRVQTQP